MSLHRQHSLSNTHLHSNLLFSKTLTKKISTCDSVDGLGDFKSSNEEEAATMATEGGGGKGPHHGGESIEMNVVSLNHLTSYKLLVSRMEV